MSDLNLILYVATYDDAAAATADFAAFHAAARSDTAVAEAVLMHRDDSGGVKVAERGGGYVAEGAGIGASAGLVLGLLAPPLLLATAVGAGVGALGGELARKHEAKELGFQLDDVVPRGSSAVVAVVDDSYADQLDQVLPGAVSRARRAIDSGDYVKLAREIGKGSPTILDSLPQ